MSSDVWVTGLGAVTSAGWTVDSAWDAVVHGRSCIGAVERFPIFDAATRVCGPVPGTGTAVGHDDVLAARFGIAALTEALGDAGLVPGDVDVLIAGNHGERRIPAGDESTVLVTPQQLVRRLADAAGADRSMAIYGACASGGLAIGTAMQLIRAGSADVVVAGGSDSMLRDYDFFQFCNLYAMSTRDCPAAEACCPFDARRDGFVLSEGAGFVVLESEGHARRRGAEPRAVLAGFGSSQNAYHIVASPPDAIGPSRAIAGSLRDAGVAPEAVGYINAHGTSTRDNDWCESLAVARVFGDAASSVPISSNKSVLGHAMAAAGAVEAVLSVRALETGVVPPTINLDEPDARCPLDYVPGTAREADLRYVMSNSFGFGGHNSTLLFRRP